MSNRQSTIDIPVLFVAIPVPFRFAAKKALQYVPFLGWYLKLAGFPMIDRHNHRDAVETLDRAGAQIRSGSSIVMFPRGPAGDGVVLPFKKKGPFSLAMRAASPHCTRHHPRGRHPHAQELVGPSPQGQSAYASVGPLIPSPSKTTGMR